MQLETWLVRCSAKHLHHLLGLLHLLHLAESFLEGVREHVGGEHAFDCRCSCRSRVSSRQARPTALRWIECWVFGR